MAGVVEEEALLEFEVSWLPNLKPDESLAPEEDVIPNLNPPAAGKEGAVEEEEAEDAPNLKPVEPVVVESVLVVPMVRKGEGPEEVEVVERIRPPPGPTVPGAGPLLRDCGTDPAHIQGACSHPPHTHTRNAHVLLQ